MGTCASATECGTCMDNFKLESKKCVSTVKCDAKKYADAAGKCQNCDTSCENCNGAGASSCTSCPSGKTLNAGKCFASKIAMICMTFILFVALLGMILFE